MMKRRERAVRTAALVGVMAGVAGTASAQFVPTTYRLTADERTELTAGRDRLRAAVAELRTLAGSRSGPAREGLPDVEIYLDGMDRTLRQELWFASRDVTAARNVVREGLARAEALQRGDRPWLKQTGPVTLGYRSELDGSVQPYQVYVPAFRPPSPTGPGARLDLFLHGRAGTLSEVNFLTGTGWVNSSFGTPTPRNLALYPYGRGNNGWRFGGERDAFEALADLQKRFRIDPREITLRGFSMGGHGCWHLGLQHPDRWAVMAPGAGFTDTKIYQKITTPLPEWQERLLHMYDPVDYAINAYNLPVLAYAGEEDPAVGQHELMVSRLRAEGAPHQVYIGSKTPHRYEPKVLATILERMATPRSDYAAPVVDFITYTLRFPECKWVRLEGLERHWDRAEVHARRMSEHGVDVMTRNVSAVSLTASSMLRGGEVQYRIDGQPAGVSAFGNRVTFVKTPRGWKQGKPEGLRKRPGLTGPIDDALFGPVLAVRGTGTAWRPSLQQWSDAELVRFRRGWDEFFRATLPEKADIELSAEDVRGKNLYLFGDPGSNAVLRRLLPRLPLKWTRDAFTLAGRSFSTADHVPVLVFPNPESPDRYVVIDCGFSFSQEDWHGSNARQYAHLPDYAALRYGPGQYSDDHRQNAVLAGFFDERWRVPATSSPGRTR